MTKKEKVLMYELFVQYITEIYGAVESPSQIGSKEYTMNTRRGKLFISFKEEISDDLCIIFCRIECDGKHIKYNFIHSWNHWDGPGSTLDSAIDHVRETQPIIPSI